MCVLRAVGAVVVVDIEDQMQWDDEVRMWQGPRMTEGRVRTWANGIAGVVRNERFVSGWWRGVR